MLALGPAVGTGGSRATGVFSTCEALSPALAAQWITGQKEVVRWQIEFTAQHEQLSAGESQFSYDEMKIRNRKISFINA